MNQKTTLVILMLVVGSMWLGIMYSIGADSVNERWHDWMECKQGNDIIKIARCDEHYKPPIEWNK